MIPSDFLSEFGKRIYLPKGITVQSEEAKTKATRHNATAGVAKENNHIMFFSSFLNGFSDSLTPDEIFPYAPMGGTEALRKKWADELYLKNPSLAGKTFSKPIVTCGITNSLNIVSRLFIDKNDAVVIPTLRWENYDLIFGTQCEAKLVEFELFEENGFNIRDFERAISSVTSEKVAVLLNFPNNPTGYSPSVKEAEAILNVLKKHASDGKKILLILDDSYFGLFYEENIFRESFFAKACDLDENILAVKCDGVTKEKMAWGFRIAFITFGLKGASEKDYYALSEKTLGAIRSCVSSCSLPAQNIILKGLNNPEHEKEKKVLFEKIQKHYLAMKDAVKKHMDCKSLHALPFNSGYFMSFKTDCNAERLRKLLLDQYNIGTVAISENILRVTFSSVNASDINDLMDCICKAADSLL